MNIYFIKLDDKKYKQYKTYEESYKDFEKLISHLPNLPNLIIEIGLEEYCEFGHDDSCCKIYSLCKYENGIINKYI